MVIQSDFSGIGSGALGAFVETKFNLKSKFDSGLNESASVIGLEAPAVGAKLYLDKSWAEPLVDTIESPLATVTFAELNKTTKISPLSTGPAYNTTTAEGAYKAFFTDGVFDKVKFETFVNDLLKVKDTNDFAARPLDSWALDKIATAMGFVGNPNAASAFARSPAGAMLSHPQIGPAIYQLNATLNDIKLSGGTGPGDSLINILAEAFKNMKPEGYASILQAGNANSPSFNEIFSIIGTKGGLENLVRGILGNKKTLGESDLAQLAFKLGFNTLNEMLHNKNGGKGLGDLIAKFNTATPPEINIQDVPGFISGLEDVMSAVSMTDGNAALTASEYQAFLDIAFLQDSTPVSANGTLLGPISAATIEKFVGANGGAGTHMNAPQLSLLAKSLGFKNLQAMLDHPDMKNVIARANENGGVPGYYNVNVRTFLDGVGGQKGFVKLMTDVAATTLPADDLGKIELSDFVAQQSGTVIIIDPPPPPPLEILPIRKTENEMTQAGYVKVLTSLSPVAYGWKSPEGQFYNVTFKDGKSDAFTSTTPDSKLIGNYGNVLDYLRSQGYSYLVPNSSPPEFKKNRFSTGSIFLHTTPAGSSDNASLNVMYVTATGLTTNTSNGGNGNGNPTYIQV